MKHDTDLFGNTSFANMSGGEISVEYTITQTREIMISRSDWMLANVPMADSLLLDMEGHILLAQATQSFITGADVATILCAVAFLERLLTDAIETRGEVNAGNRGFGNVLGALESLRLLHPYLVTRLKHLNKVRVNFSHEKGPDHEYRLFRRSLEFVRCYPNSVEPEIVILRNDAREAICFAYALANKIPRYFPRLALPGHEGIKES